MKQELAQRYKDSFMLALYDLADGGIEKSVGTEEITIYIRNNELINMSDEQFNRYHDKVIDRINKLKYRKN